MGKVKLFTLLLLFGYYSFAADWKFETEKDGVKIYSRKVKGTNILSFKAVGFVDAPLDKMLAALRNVEVATEWDKSLLVKKTLKDHSLIEADTYSVVDLPTFFDDRELVLNNILDYDEKTHELIVRAKSVDLKDAPRNKKYTRAEIRIAEFRIKPENDLFTKMSMECMVDPKGDIPPWLANIVQQDMPYNFIKNLEKFANKYKGEANKEILKFIAKQKEDIEKASKTVTKAP